MNALYSESFRKNAVRLVETSGLSKKAIAQKLEISTSTLNRWIRLSGDAETGNSDDLETRYSEQSLSQTDDRVVGAGHADTERKPLRIRSRSTKKSSQKSNKKKTENNVAKFNREALKSSPLTINRSQVFKLKSTSQLWWQRIRYVVAAVTLLVGVNAFLFWWPSTNSVLLSPQLPTLYASAPLPDREPNGDIDARLEMLGEFAKLAPLSPDPYELRLNELSTKTDELDIERLTALSEAVLERDKRRVAPRLIRLQNFVATSDWERAVNELSNIYTLWPDGRERVVETLIELMSLNASTHAIIIDELTSKPRWGLHLVSRLPIESLATIEVRRAIAKYPDQHSKYIQEIARTRGYRSAFLTWLSLLETNDNRIVSFPIDANFDGNDAPKPFNWSFHHSHAELDRNGGLYVNYDGRKQTRIAWQIMLLTAGDYILTTAWDGAYTQRAGNLEWRISCQDSDKELSSLKLSGDLDVAASHEVEFRVPNGSCSFLTLGLYGIPGEYPDTIRVTIDYAQITTAGVDKE